MVRKKKHKKAKALFFFVLCVTLLSVPAVMLERRLSRIVAEIASQSVKAKASVVISKAIYDELEKSAVTYDDLVSFEKDSEGRISALKTNIIEVNKLKSSLSLKILESLRNTGEMSVTIPIGTVLNSELLSGRGPDIKVKVMPIGTVAADIDNVITSAGINQTRHQVMLYVSVQIAVITAVRNTSANVSTNVCIAETVIVGGVPESYTNIDASTAEGGEQPVIDPDTLFNFVY